MVIIAVLLVLTSAALIAALIALLLPTTTGWNLLVTVARLTRPARITPPLPESMVMRPPVVSPPMVLLSSVVAAGVVGALAAALAAGDTTAIGMHLVGRIGTVMLLTTVVCLLTILATALVARARYVRTLDRALTLAMERLGTTMDSGQSFSQAVDYVVRTMPPQHPLVYEWKWLLDRLGAQRPDGSRYMMHEVCAILAAQTLSLRHAGLLLRLGDALQRPHDAQVQAIRVMIRALNETAKRRSTMLVELAQVRTSGIAISLINGGILAYLIAVQRDKVITAYSSPIGLIVGIIIAICISAPVVVGMWLSRVEDDIV